MHRWWTDSSALGPLNGTISSGTAQRQFFQPIQMRKKYGSGNLRTLHTNTSDAHVPFLRATENETTYTLRCISCEPSFSLSKCLVLLVESGRAYYTWRRAVRYKRTYVLTYISGVRLIAEYQFNRETVGNGSVRCWILFFAINWFRLTFAIFAQWDYYGSRLP